MGPVGTASVRLERSEALGFEDLGELAAGDVLFVDTTHTVKTGGDCQNIYLHLLPRLNPGVFVHIHDIFIPYDYPQRWVMEERRAWAEQYLLQAFLVYNTRFEVTLPLHALLRLAHAEVTALVPSFEQLSGAGAFWIEARG